MSKGKWYGHGSYYHMWVKGNDTVMEVLSHVSKGKRYGHGSVYHMWVKGNVTVMEVIVTCD